MHSVSNVLPNLTPALTDANDVAVSLMELKKVQIRLSSVCLVGKP